MVAPFYRGPLPARALSAQLYEGQDQSDLSGQPIGLTERKVPKPAKFDGVDFSKAIERLKGFGSPLEDQYELSPTAKKTKDFLSEKIGKELVLQKVDPFTPEDVAAYYVSEGPGGSLDEEKRALYVRPDVSYPVLFHEAGHAADPALATRTDTFNPNVVRDIRDPGARLEYVFEHLGKPKVKSETEAQSFVGRNLPGYEKQNPNLGSESSRFVNQPYFKEYPASYGTKAIDNFYRAELGGRGQVVTEEDADRGVAMRTFQPSSDTALNFALNSELREKENELLDFTRQYIDTRLNQFQNKPTQPAADYFSPVN